MTDVHLRLCSNRHISIKKVKYLWGSVQMRTVFESPFQWTFVTYKVGPWQINMLLFYATHRALSKMPV